jgi:hypothetical protein
MGCPETLAQEARGKQTDGIPFQDSLQQADVTLTNRGGL